MAQDIFELADEPLEDFEDALDQEDLEWDDSAELGEVLGEALHDDYADVGADDLADALTNVLESMSPAEAFNFTKALRQIGRSAQTAVSDPTVNQIVRSALPAAGGALGTVIGGPVGTALGSKLGTAAARALPGAPPPAAALKPAAPAVAGGSAAAAQGLVLTQQPDVLQSLLALAMGQHGQKSVNGVPVASVMNMLSSVFGQAAADADELMYLDTEQLGDYGEAADDAGLPVGRPLYTTLMDAENAELAEAVEYL